MQIDITHDIPALNEHLTALQQRLNGNLTPLMQAIGEMLVSSTKQRFVDEESPSGVSWATLAGSTIQAKNGRTGILKSGYGGGLMDSIHAQADNNSVIVGTDKVYGKYHQTGTAPYEIRPKEKKALKFNGRFAKVVHHPGLPARPFLGLSEQDKSDIGDLINDFLAGNL